MLEVNERYLGFKHFRIWIKVNDKHFPCSQGKGRVSQKLYKNMRPVWHIDKWRKKY